MGIHTFSMGSRTPRTVYTCWLSTLIVFIKDNNHVEHKEHGTEVGRAGAQPQPVYFPKEHGQGPHHTLGALLPLRVEWGRALGVEAGFSPSPLHGLWQAGWCLSHRGETASRQKTMGQEGPW